MAATCQDRRTAQLTTDHARTDHKERQTDHDHATTTDGWTCRRTCHKHGTTTCTSCAHVAHGEHRHRHMHTHDHTCAHKYHTTRHTSTHPPREGGYPRIKNKAAGPLVLTLNTPQTIFELRVTHEIFTRIGHATVVAPVGVSRIHLG